ncbi:MAG TPA: ROK family protein [Bacteroidales bacterium]|nr:ROK family protein [Bacteroidales bacterium]
MESLGIDIGGSGIKAALVNTLTGELLSDRLRMATPQPSTPERVAAVVAEAALQLGWHGPAGIGFPAAVTQGIVRTATNIDHKWIGMDAVELFSEALGQPCTVLNDADAAGLAEIAFGEGRDVAGTVIVLTLGTGIGSAVFNNGILQPNTELGHLLFRGDIAEHYASDAARKAAGLSWEKWGKRLDKYLKHVENLFWPQLLILGGGSSRKFEAFAAQLTTRTPVVAARHRNQAGLIGAAMASSRART